MKLTPLDIRHKEFKRGMRGYADVEVDEFLDEVADEYERLFKENIDLSDRVEALEEKVAGYRRIEETLQKTLVNAQASAEEQKQNATKEGQLILQDAELKARQMVNEAYSERQSIEQSMAKLKSADQDFRFKFRQMLDGYLQQLGDVPPSQGEASRGEFARRAEAIKEAIAREATAGPAAVAPRPASPDREEPGLSPAVGAHEPALPPSPAVPATSAAERAADFTPTPATADDPEAPAGPEVTMSAPARETPATDAADDAEPATPAAAHDDAEAPDEGRQSEPVRERIFFGESDDLLADVDSGVNENEFKW